MPPIDPPCHPIVFIRGFAMRRADIEDAAEEVYQGFNEGSTKLRQTGSGELRQSFFESVVVRLMKDLGYVDGYRDGALLPWKGDAPARSLWVFRYYDAASDAFGDRTREPIETYARELRRFIVRTVRPSVCGEDPARRRAFKVHLVAHSMGGLIARSYLQNVCRFATPQMQADPELELSAGANDPLVHRLFTYGTPHDGIELLGRNAPDLGALSLTGARAFNREVMARYFALDRPERPWDAKARGVRCLDGAIAPNRVFNLIGTSWRDFDLPTRRLAGPRSDGVVALTNAYTEGPDENGKRVYSPRAYVQRAHGGPFGLVNSEAGYQNLRRFLFGTHRVDVALRPLAFTHAAHAQRRLDAGLDPARLKTQLYVDVAAGLRGLDEVLHERRAAHGSALLLDPDKDFGGGRELTLFTGFLDERLRLESETAMVGCLRLEIAAPTYEIDRALWFDEDLPGATMLAEQLRFSVTRSADGPVLSARRRLADGRLRNARPASAGRQGSSFEWRLPIGFDPAAPDPPPGAVAADLIVRVRPHA